MSFNTAGVLDPRGRQHIKYTDTAQRLLNSMTDRGIEAFLLSKWEDGSQCNFIKDEDMVCHTWRSVSLHQTAYTLKKKKMPGCFNQTLGNPNVGLKMQYKNVQWKVKVEVGLNDIFNPTFGFVHILPQKQHCLECTCCVVYSMMFLL